KEKRPPRRDSRFQAITWREGLLLFRLGGRRRGGHRASVRGRSGGGVGRRRRGVGGRSSGVGSRNSGSVSGRGFGRSGFFFLLAGGEAQGQDASGGDGQNAKLH